MTGDLMNKKKTEALTFPTNPLAAMRELQDLDQPAAEIPPDPPVPEPETPQQQTYRQIEPQAARSVDPVRQAIIQVLAEPFAGDPLKGPFTVTTVKVPTVIWERLALYAQLTGEAKQEILGKALKEFLRPGRTR
jgi:hypothetical protein